MTYNGLKRSEIYNGPKSRLDDPVVNHILSSELIQTMLKLSFYPCKLMDYFCIPHFYKCTPKIVLNYFKI